MACQTEDHQLRRYDIVIIIISLLLKPIIKTLQHFEVSDEHSGALLTGNVEFES